MYMRKFAKTGRAKGYEVVIINARGSAGVKATSQRIHIAFNHDDVLEVMTSVYERYPNRKVFAVGASMGGNNLTNLLGFEGENTFITAACAIQPHVKYWNWPDHFKKSFFGIYNIAIGKAMT